MDTVLVVEDSRPIQRILRRLFEADSLQVSIASDGPSGLQQFRKQLPGVVVLDLNLPGISGKELCREFKALAAVVPIVVLSGNTEVEDKVLLLELGADDYVTKPFSPKELLARVRRAMRRNGTMLPIATNIQTTPIHQDILTFGDACVDFRKMEARRAGKLVILTTHEFKLLEYLALSGERVVSRNELIKQVWGYHSYPSTRIVDNFVLRLRQKLEPDPSTPRFLVTMYGVGYKFIPDGRSPI